LATQDASISKLLDHYFDDVNGDGGTTLVFPCYCDLETKKIGMARIIWTAILTWQILRLV
jgi:hypothetical protein